MENKSYVISPQNSTATFIMAPYLNRDSHLTATPDNGEMIICESIKMRNMVIKNPEAAPIFPPQINTPEEQRFYKLCQTAKKGRDLVEFIKWMRSQTQKKQHIQSHTIPISDEAKVLMLRALMYNLNLRKILHELGAEDSVEHKAVDSVINICIKDNKKLNCRMFRSPGEGCLLNPRVYQGDTIMHITGRLGFYNLINKICTRPNGSELLAMPNSCGFTPVAAIGDQMHRLSVKKNEIDPEIYAAYHDQLKGCKSTADSHTMIACKEHPVHLLDNKIPFLKRIFNLLASVASEGIFSTALSEADYVCDRLIDNRRDWLGFRPVKGSQQTSHNTPASESMFLVNRNGKALLLYGQPDKQNSR